MLKLSLCCVVLVAGCRPLYQADGERLRNPKLIAHVPIPEPGPVKPTYVDKCEVDFRRDPVVVRDTGTKKSPHVIAGDVKLAQAEVAVAAAKVDLVIQGIESYRKALQLDPYDAEATLQLARAYDQVFYKGCALALLKRLDELAQHPKLGIAAKPRARKVADNREWFREYRKEALEAIGRSLP
ncbi:MAG: hypothetical protein WKG01_21095 [Kofleriaceae bacterium]